MPCLPHLHLGGPLDIAKTEAGERMSGFLEIFKASPLGSSERSSTSGTCTFQKVFVRVYETSSEHFAVVYPVKAFVSTCTPLMTVNLRSCVLEYTTHEEFKVAPRSCDGLALTFKVSAKSGPPLGTWVQAFTGEHAKKKVSDLKTSLPVVSENEEEECSV